MENVFYLECRSGIDNPSDGLEVWLLYYLTHPNMVIVPEMKRRKRAKRAA